MQGYIKKMIYTSKNKKITIKIVIRAKKVGGEGFKPPTFRVEAEHSIQLN